MAQWSWVNNLATVISKLPTSALTDAGAVGSTITGWFTSKFAPITLTFQQLEGIGPTGNPDQLNGLLSKLKMQFTQINGVPGAEYSYETTLAGLVGKNDAGSIELWNQTCQAAIATLQAAAASGASS